jgi:hypothetical protein
MSEVSERLSERIAREWCDYADAHSDGFDADPDGLVATFCAAAIASRRCGRSGSEAID